MTRQALDIALLTQLTPDTLVAAGIPRSRAVDRMLDLLQEGCIEVRRRGTRVLNEWIPDTYRRTKKGDARLLALRESEGLDRAASGSK
jgi:hypothetical protein